MRTLTGSLNYEDNPVDWTKLKNVPAGFADGSDAEGGGAGDGRSNTYGSPWNSYPQMEKISWG